MSRAAIITGITGQDGSYLAELLLEKDYHVYGLVRRVSTINTQRISSILSHPKLTICDADLSDINSLLNVFTNVIHFDRIEVYNLGAQSHVHTSFRQPEYTADVDGLGPLRLLECIRTLHIESKTRFYQASTSELYGKVYEVPQTEKTPFYPRSPYAVAKLYAYWIVRNYRESYGIFACNGILFNHESERRGKEFVTRKITLGVARVLEDPNFVIELGNLESKRDWGYAPDYVRGMWLMLQQDKPEDYVLATGELHSIRDCVEIAFQNINKKITWVNDEGYDETNRLVVRVNPEYYRPCEVDLLQGDYSKAHRELNWTPTVSFKEMIALMVKHDIKNK